MSIYLMADNQASKILKSHANVTQKSHILTNSFHFSRILSYKSQNLSKRFRDIYLSQKSHTILTQISLISTICHASWEKVTQPEKFW